MIDRVRRPVQVWARAADLMQSQTWSLPSTMDLPEELVLVALDCDVSNVEVVKRIEALTRPDWRAEYNPHHACDLRLVLPATHSGPAGTMLQLIARWDTVTCELVCPAGASWDSEAQYAGLLVEALRPVVLRYRAVHSHDLKPRLQFE